jgi:glycine betaine/proline transport system substrate-binding protein
MIDKNAFGLKTPVSSGAVQRSRHAVAGRPRAEARQAMVFLGWEPHPMNTRFKMKYLTGGDDSSAPTSARPPC